MTFEKEKNYSLKCASFEIFKAMHQFVIEKTDIRAYKGVEEYATEDYSDFPNLNITKERIAADCRTAWGNNTILLTTEEFIEYCNNYKKELCITIRLTDKYDAIVDKKNKTVTVGCQVIPFDKVLEITALF